MAPKSTDYYPAGRDDVIKTSEQWMDSRAQCYKHL
jgi:hypothetical protein